MSKRMVFVLVVCFVSLAGRRARAQDFVDPPSALMLSGYCFLYYFDTHGYPDSWTPPSFANREDFDTAWSLPGWTWNGTRAIGQFETVPAGLNVDANDCATWNWVHIINASARLMVIIPSGPGSVGHHYDGDPVTAPISYCIHSNITYVVFGRDSSGNTSILGYGQKWGTNETSGPCATYSVTNNFPCSLPNSDCGTDLAGFDSSQYAEIWIGMVSWSHDHMHFPGTDPYTSVWWDSLFSYNLFF